MAAKAFRDDETELEGEKSVSVHQTFIFISYFLEVTDHIYRLKLCLTKIPIYKFWVFLNNYLQIIINNKFTNYSSA